MEFIGFFGKRAEVDFDGLINTASLLGLHTIIDEYDYDSEVSMGLRYFRDATESDFLIQLVLPVKNGKQTTTSNFLTEELSNYYIHNSKSLFIELLTEIERQEIKVGKMYIVFASEWTDAEQLVRYFKSSLKQVHDYFKVNNGWQLTFYSLQSKSYQLEFDCPLIFEISDE